MTTNRQVVVGNDASSEGYEKQDDAVLVHLSEIDETQVLVPSPSKKRDLSRPSKPVGRFLNFIGHFNSTRFFVGRLNSLLSYTTDYALPGLIKTFSNFGFIANAVELTMDVGDILYAGFANKDPELSFFGAMAQAFTQDDRRYRMYNAAFWFFINLAAILATNGATLILNIVSMSASGPDILHDCYVGYKHYQKESAEYANLADTPENAAKRAAHQAAMVDIRSKVLYNMFLIGVSLVAMGLVMFPPTSICVLIGLSLALVPSVLGGFCKGASTSFYAQLKENYAAYKEAKKGYHEALEEQARLKMAVGAAYCNTSEQIKIQDQIKANEATLSDCANKMATACHHVLRNTAIFVLGLVALGLVLFPPTSWCVFAGLAIGAAVGMFAKYSKPPQKTLDESAEDNLYQGHDGYYPDRVRLAAEHSPTQQVSLMNTFVGKDNQVGAVSYRNQPVLPSAPVPIPGSTDSKPQDRLIGVKPYSEGLQQTLFASPVVVPQEPEVSVPEVPFLMSI